MKRRRIALGLATVVVAGAAVVASSGNGGPRDVEIINVTAARLRPVADCADLAASLRLRIGDAAAQFARGWLTAATSDGRFPVWRALPRFADEGARVVRDPEEADNARVQGDLLAVVRKDEDSRDLPDELQVLAVADLASRDPLRGGRL